MFDILYNSEEKQNQMTNGPVDDEGCVNLKFGIFDICFKVRIGPEAP